MTFINFFNDETDIYIVTYKSMWEPEPQECVCVCVRSVKLDDLYFSARHFPWNVCSLPLQ